MDAAVSQPQDNRKWLVLALAMFTNTLVAAAPMMCMPVLFAEIAADLNLTLVQLGVIWGISALPGIVTMLLGGAVGDHFGPKRVLIVTCLLVGLAGALRGLANGFVSLTVFMLLFGMVSPFVTLNTFKNTGTWFPSNQLGFASGINSMGMALGFLLSSMFSAAYLSPLLGGWRNVLFFYGALSALMAIPWLLVWTQPKGAVVTSQPRGPVFAALRETTGKMLRIRNVWLYGLVIFGIGGCIQGTLGYLPLYLRGLGWEPVSADGAAAAFHTVSMIGTIPIALLSDRLRTRKKVMAAAGLMVALGVLLLALSGSVSLAASTVVVWLGVLAAGSVRDGFMAVFTTSILETEGVGPKYAGTAMGMVFVLGGIGNLIAPAAGNSFARLSPSAPFLFWAALTVVGFAGLLLAAERKPRPAFEAGV